MRCPRCGEPLEKVDRDIAPVDIDTLSLSDALDEVCSVKDQSEHWQCNNEACDLCPPCYFNVHHPFRGPNSAPGDSWSISWIK